MSGESPDVVLYSSDGYELAVINGSSIPNGTRGQLVSGSDGTNSRFITVDSSGRQLVVGAGVAGTPAGGIITIQGAAGGTVVPVSGTITANIGTTNGLALDTSVTGLVVAQASTTSGQKGILTLGAVTTAAPAYTTAQTSPLSLTTTGLLRVDGSGVTQPISGTVTANQGGSPWSQNVTQFGGVNISTGTGASGTGIPRVTVANDSNILSTQSGTWTVQPGNTANTTPWLITINQGSNSAAVKAASTAAATTDPALVVAISPNNTISVTTPSGGFGGQVEGRATDGSTPVGNPVYIAGFDGTNIQAVSTDTSGRIVIAPTGTTASVSGFSLGTVTTASTNLTAVRGTTYNEQASNAQRSISSANVADTSAGTGARQVKITYYDSTGAGPSTETVTLNGTTAVNTTNVNICYVEKMEVVSTGSGGSNAGVITLFVGTAGAGGTLGTIAVGDNRTYWCHHYTPTGKTTYITGVSGNNNNSSNGSILSIRAKTIGVTVPEQVVSDFVRVGAGSVQATRIYGTAIQVAGPARVILYEQCEGTATIVTRASFDFYDQ